MSESESTPDQAATESSTAPVSKAKPILRKKDSGDQPPSEPRTERPRPERGGGDGGKERGKAKGKGRDRKDREEPQAKVSAALMRGPKFMPPKPEPEPEPEPVVEEESVSPESTDEAVETVEVAPDAE